MLGIIGGNWARYYLYWCTEVLHLENILEPPIPRSLLAVTSKGVCIVFVFVRVLYVFRNNCVGEMNDGRTLSCWAMEGLDCSTLRIWQGTDSVRAVIDTNRGMLGKGSYNMQPSPADSTRDLYHPANDASTNKDRF